MGRQSTRHLRPRVGAARPPRRGGRPHGGGTAARTQQLGQVGAEDHPGTTNPITPELIRAAKDLIETGETLSLAIPIDAQAPV